MYVWCETWFPTLRRGVFENRVLRKKLGPNREEVMGGLRKSRNEELLHLYLSFDIIWGIKKRGYNGKGTSHVWGK